MYARRIGDRFGPGVLIGGSIIVALTFSLPRHADAQADCMWPAATSDSFANGPSSVDLGDYSESEVEALEAGEIVVRRAADQYEGVAIVEAEARSVWRVLIDFDTWPRIVPNVESVSVQGSSEDHRLHQRFKFLWTRYEATSFWSCEMGGYSARLRLRLDPTAPSDFERLETVFDVAQIGDGPKSIVRVRTLAETGVPMPQIIRMAIARSVLPDSLAALSREVTGF